MNIPMPNQAQIESAIRWLLTTGGPLAGWLVSQGASQTQISQIMAVALVVVPPAVSFVWGLMRKTDKQITAAAGAMPGVHVAVDVGDNSPASEGAKAAALDPKVNGVSPT